jgi:hypothetical protein
VLYGKPAIQDTPETPATTDGGDGTPTRDVADILLGGVPSLVSSYGPALADSVDRLSDRTGMSLADRDAHIADMATTFDDARIMPDDAARLHPPMVQHITTPVDDVTVTEWATEARRQLRDRYGLDEAQRPLAVAKHFIANRPGLLKLLEATGLGSHPDIVMALAEHPERLQLTARAKK